jgi:solute carrier family 6 amino acid transporter-like protein 5/7/9/14
VFVVYPAAVARLPISQLWSILFFSMLFSVGIGSQFGMFQTMTSGFTDEFKFLQTPRRKLLVTAGLCMVEFIIGLICITEVGASGN